MEDYTDIIRKIVLMKPKDENSNNQLRYLLLAGRAFEVARQIMDYTNMDMPAEDVEKLVLDLKKVKLEMQQFCD